MVKEIEDQSGEEVDRKREGRVGGVTALPSWMISQDLEKSLGLQEAVLYSLGTQCKRKSLSSFIEVQFLPPLRRKPHCPFSTIVRF